MSIVHQAPMRAVVLSGGLTHDFAATTECLEKLLADAGLSHQTHTDVDAALHALPGAALFVVNALRWTMTCPGTPTRYRELAPEHAVSPSASARARLTEHLGHGGGLLGMHTASICFDDWPAWRRALGGAWRWGRSHHPPIGEPVRLHVTGDHPVVSGLGEFTVVDEVYSDLELEPDVEPLLEAAHPGTDQPRFPLLWARRYGGGRVVYDALGHHSNAYEVPEHHEIVRRAIGWAAGQDSTACRPPARDARY